MSRKDFYINKIEKQLNIDSLENFLYNLYVNEKKTAREIADIIYGKPKNSPNVLKWLHYFNIPLRHGSEAIKTQYIGEKGQIRKELARLNLDKGLNSKKSKDNLRKTMQTKEYKEKQSKAHLGNKNGMYGLTGEKNPLWNPNKTRLQRQKDRKLKENIDWRNNVFKRDDYSCQITGRKKNLVAHHLNGYHWCVNDRFNINNGITLCEEVHKLFHRCYGMKNNTKEQFEEFKTKYLNKEITLTE